MDRVSLSGRSGYGGHDLGSPGRGTDSGANRVLYRHRRADTGVRTESFKSRLFKPDKYSDRKGKEHWTQFAYPFQFTDLLTAIDSLGKLGFSADDPEIVPVIDWFRQRQKPDGSLELNMCRGISDRRLALWLGLAAARALLRFKERS